MWARSGYFTRNTPSASTELAEAVWGEASLVVILGHPTESQIVDVNINRPELVMIAVYAKSLRPDDASEGRMLTTIPGCG